ncbi:hypothetical protein MAR_019622 [Mya arenaria]|uniref:Uncharacterized protein n=1 Tax=Mya arenaria TaxID=6604 RepID=A0ABY7E634_MYAAR|nr:hypothetical protein MAR_019622 [Mya arenaria]
MEVITNWSKQLLVNFNASKTGGMIFSNRFPRLPNIQFNNVEINFVKHHKHLGIELNEDVYIYIIYATSSTAVVWDGCTVYEKENLEKLQYEAARIVTGLTRSVSIDNLMKEIGWVSLADRRKIPK